MPMSILHLLPPDSPFAGHHTPPAFIFTELVRPILIAYLIATGKKPYRPAVVMAQEEIGYAGECGETPRPRSYAGECGETPRPRSYAVVGCPRPGLRAVCREHSGPGFPAKI